MTDLSTAAPTSAEMWPAKPESEDARAAGMPTDTPIAEPASAVLARLAADGWRTLDDRLASVQPRTVIDHLAVGPGGIFTIDSHSLAGSGPDFSVISDANQPAKIATAHAAADAIRALLPPLSRQYVVAVLAFADTSPMSMSRGPVQICTTSMLQRVVDARRNVLSTAEIDDIVTILDGALRPAGSPARQVVAPTAPTAPTPPAPTATVDAAEESRPTPAPRRGRRFLGRRGNAQAQETAPPPPSPPAAEPHETPSAMSEPSWAADFAPTPVLPPTSYPESRNEPTPAADFAELANEPSRDVEPFIPADQLDAEKTVADLPSEPAVASIGNETWQPEVAGDAPLDAPFVAQTLDPENSAALPSPSSDIDDHTEQADVTSPDLPAPEAATSETLAPDTLTSETVAPDTLTSETVVPETLTSEALAPDTLTSEVAVPETITAEGVTADPATAEVVTADPATAEAVTADPATAEAVTADPATAEVVTADAVAPGVLDGDDEYPAARSTQPLDAEALHTETDSDGWSQPTTFGSHLRLGSHRSTGLSDDAPELAEPVAEPVAESYPSDLPEDIQPLPALHLDRPSDDEDIAATAVAPVDEGPAQQTQPSWTAPSIDEVDIATAQPNTPEVGDHVSDFPTDEETGPEAAADVATASAPRRPGARRKAPAKPWHRLVPTKTAPPPSRRIRGMDAADSTTAPAPTSDLPAPIGSDPAAIASLVESELDLTTPVVQASVEAKSLTPIVSDGSLAADVGVSDGGQAATIEEQYSGLAEPARLDEVDAGSAILEATKLSEESVTRDDAPWDVQDNDVQDTTFVDATQTSSDGNADLDIVDTETVESECAATEPDRTRAVEAEADQVTTDESPHANDIDMHQEQVDLAPDATLTAALAASGLEASTAAAIEEAWPADGWDEPPSAGPTLAAWDDVIAAHTVDTKVRATDVPGLATAGSVTPGDPPADALSLVVSRWKEARVGQPIEREPEPLPDRPATPSKAGRRGRRNQEATATDHDATSPQNLSSRGRKMYAAMNKDVDPALVRDDATEKKSGGIIRKVLFALILAGILVYSGLHYTEISKWVDDHIDLPSIGEPTDGTHKGNKNDPDNGKSAKPESGADADNGNSANTNR